MRRDYQTTNNYEIEYALEKEKEIVKLLHGLGIVTYPTFS